MAMLEWVCSLFSFLLSLFEGDSCELTFFFFLFAMHPCPQACKMVIEYSYNDPEEGQRNVVEETLLVRCLLFWAILHSLCTHLEEHMQA